MGKPDYVDNALAERDAEIELLKAELADTQQDVATLLTTVEQQRQYIERLKAQVEKWTELHKLSVALPERSEDDAEITALRKRVAEADQIVRAGEAERKALAAQVAELQANNAALTAQVSQWLDDDGEVACG